MGTQGKSSVSLTVSAPSGGFPGFMAYQDGDSPWKPLSESGGAYSFSVTDAAGRYGLCIGTTEQAGAAVHAKLSIFYGTLAEMGSLAIQIPQPEVPGPAVTGNLLGLASTDVGTVTIGGSAATGILPDAAAFSLSPGPAGVYDLISCNSVGGTNGFGPASRVLVKRGIPTSLGANLGNLDLNADGVATQSQAIAVTGLGNAGAIVFEAFAGFDTAQRLKAGQGFVDLGGQVDLSNASAGRYPAVPASRLQSGDLQEFRVRKDWRSAVVYFKTPQDLHVDMPLDLAAPTVDETSTAPSPRVTVRWTPLAGAGAHALTLAQSDASGNSTAWTVVMTKGWAGGNASLQYAQPDLSALPKWNPAFSLQTHEQLASVVASVLYAGQGRYFGLENYGFGWLGSPVDGDVVKISEAPGPVFSPQ